jgi:hypothetical protein
MGGVLFSILSDSIQQAVQWCALAEKSSGSDPFMLEWITPIKAKLSNAMVGGELETTLEYDSDSNLDSVVDELKTQLLEYNNKQPSV